MHYVQYQYFLFYILLIWGVRTQRTPLPTGLDSHRTIAYSRASIASRVEM